MVTNHGTIRSQLYRWRLVIRVVVVLGLLFCGGAWSAGTVLASHTEVIAEVDCAGKVSFTATAFQPGDNNPLRRTNPRVDVFYSVDGGKSVIFLPWKESWQYSPSNDFQFTDTFKLPDPLPQNVIVGVKKSRWANGSSPGRNYKTAPINIPSCPPETQPAAPAEGSAAVGGISDAVGPGAPLAPALQAAPASAGGSNIAIIFVVALLGVALVIDGVGITIFVRRRRSHAAQVAAAYFPSTAQARH
jgi:hypothetical protein